MDKKAEGHIKETTNDQSSHIGGHFNRGFESKIEKIEMQLEKAQNTLEELQSMKERLEEEKRLNDEKAKFEQEKLSLVEIRDENKKLKSELKTYQSEINSLRDVIGALKDDLSKSAEIFQTKVARSLKVLEEADSALSKNALEAEKIKFRKLEPAEDEEEIIEKPKKIEAAADEKLETEDKEEKSAEAQTVEIESIEEEFTDAEAKKAEKKENREFKEEVLIEELSEYEKIKQELEEIVHSNIFTHDEETDPVPPVTETPVIVENKPEEQKQTEKPKKKGLFSFLSRKKKDDKSVTAETPKTTEAAPATAETPVAAPALAETAPAIATESAAPAPTAAAPEAAKADAPVADEKAAPAPMAADANAEAETEKAEATDTPAAEETTAATETEEIVEAEATEEEKPEAEVKPTEIEPAKEEPKLMEEKPVESAPTKEVEAKSAKKDTVKKIEKKEKVKKEKTGGGTKLIMRTAVFLLIVTASFTWYRIKNADKLREALTNQVQQAYSKTPSSNTPEEFTKKTPEEKYPTAYVDLPFEKTIWATQNDTNLGIKVDYPQNTSYRLRPVDSNNLWFLRKNGYLMKIEKKESEATYDEFLAGFVTDIHYKVENVTFHGKVAVHLVPTEEIPVPGDYYIVKVGKSILTIWYRTYAPGENPDDEKRVQKMIDSIEFPTDSKKSS